LPKLIDNLKLPIPLEIEFKNSLFDIGDDLAIGKRHSKSFNFFDCGLRAIEDVNLLELSRCLQLIQPIASSNRAIELQQS
jgi:hypothetical protein